MSLQAASKLFKPLQLGRIGKLQHRVVLAPLTRNRASEPTLAPNNLAVQYYRQRASEGGLLISEATHISPESLAYASTPGIFTNDQVEGWKKVTDAVHEKGGKVVCQMWHTGRVAHPDFSQHPINKDLNYEVCRSSSATQIVNKKGKPGKTLTYDGVKDHEVPKPLSEEDIVRLCEDYARAAKCTKEAGFDGVEIHAAHGYLLDQFMNNGVNTRTDKYGGSVENRCRILSEVLDSVLTVWDADQVGIRISPHDAPNGGNTFYGCADSDPDTLYARAFEVLNGYNLAYVLVTEPRWVGRHDSTPETDPGFEMPLTVLHKFRHLYDGVMIGAGGFTPTTSYSAATMENGYDALAFGRWFISNPDLPVKLEAFHEFEGRGRTGEAPPALNRYDRDGFYTQKGEGYVDYPSLEFAEYQKSGGESKSDFEGMETGKYPLVEQDQIGQTLKSTEKRSKL